MAFVYELVKRFDAGEKETVRALNLQDREKAVLEAMLLTNKKVFPASTICNRLGIQTSHFDKIKSNLLKKILEGLAGTDIYEQVAYVNKKSGLWNLNKHLLKEYEQKNIASDTKAVQSFRFYKFIFEWYVSIPFSHQDEEELQSYVKKMVHFSTPEKTGSTKLWTQIVLLQRELKLLTSKATVKIEEHRKLMQGKLEKILDTATHMGDIQMLYRAKLLAMLVYTFLEDYVKGNSSYTEILALLQQNPDEFQEHDKLVVHVYHAQTLYHANNLDDSYALYKKIFSHFRQGEPMKWFMYHAEYLHVSLLTGHLDTAGELCNDFFIPLADDVNGSLYVSAGLQILKYYLFCDQADKAFETAAQLEKYISKTTLLQFQLAGRELTLACYYMYGDHAEANTLAEKNLKFMRFKNIHKTIPEYTYHSRLVKAIHRIETVGKPLTQNELKMLADVEKGTMAIYGVLLQRYYQAVLSGQKSQAAGH